MQVIYPQQRTLPDPLQGFGQAAKTIADAVIQSRKEQALNQDLTLVGNVMAQARKGQTPGQYGPAGYGTEGDQGEPFNPNQVVGTALQQMKTPQGRELLISKMKEIYPQQVVTVSAQGKVGAPQKVPAGAKIMQQKNEQQGTYVFNPGTGQMDYVPGRFAQVKSEPTTTVITPEGSQEVKGKVVYDPRYKEGAKRFKPELFEGPEGERKWLVPGEAVPEGFSAAGKTSKTDPTGYTREGASWMKLVGLDPAKKGSWDEFNSYRTKAKDKDIAMWALQTATSSVTKTDEYLGEKDPKKRAQMTFRAAQDIMHNRDELSGGGPGGKAGGNSPATLQNAWSQKSAQVQAMPDGPAKAAAMQQLNAWKARHLGQ